MFPSSWSNRGLQRSSSLVNTSAQTWDLRARPALSGSFQDKMFPGPSGVLLLLSLRSLPWATWGRAPLSSIVIISCVNPVCFAASRQRAGKAEKQSKISLPGKEMQCKKINPKKLRKEEEDKSWKSRKRFPSPRNDLIDKNPKLVLRND